MSRMLQKEAKESLMAQDRRASMLGIENISTIGRTRMENIIGCNKAITDHAKLLAHIDKQIKHLIAKHKTELPSVFADNHALMLEPPHTSGRRSAHTLSHRYRTRKQRKEDMMNKPTEDTCV